MLSSNFMRLLPATVLVAPAILSTAPSAQAASSPRGVLESGLKDLMGVAERAQGSSGVELAKRVRPTLEKLFNFETLTKRAIGQGWRELDPKQQKEAVALFSEILIRSYSNRFDWNNRLEIRFSEPVETGSGRIEIHAATRYAENMVDVLYRLEPAGNSWVVYDVVIEGVSLSGNYRSQFDSIRQKEGPEGLLKALRHRLNQ